MRKKELIFEGVLRKQMISLPKVRERHLRQVEKNFKGKLFPIMCHGREPCHIYTNDFSWNKISRCI